MHCARHIHTRQLIALLLLSVMVLVHAVKTLHTHSTYPSDHSCKQTNVIAKAGPVHEVCTICEFQLAKDTPFTGDIQIVIAPVHIAPTYSRLLTSINHDHFLVTESRGPPRA